MDVIANMLNTIKNGGIAHKESVLVPFSNHKVAIAKALLDAGFIAGYQKRDRNRGADMLEVTLAYQANGNSKISTIKRVSKPSRRMYISSKNVRPVKNGFGKIFISTPKGILTGEQARKEQVGGEMLFELW
ncbi:30S ribosomal protein S8 [Candidatus Nomurabacteria bacterium]|nr:30S ribosomal protein S8 [Candidatus Nomurabacteria bacterium]